MYSLIACDLDETLLNKQKEISEKNKEMIHLAKKHHVKFVVATGRGYTSIVDILKELDLYDEKDEYVIVNNGAIICENKDFRQIAYQGLTRQLAYELFKFGLNYDVCIQVFTHKDVYAYHLNEEEKGVLFSFKKDSMICEEDTLDMIQDDIVKVMFQNVDMDYLKYVATQLDDHLKEQVSISYSSNRYLEFNAKGIDKGVGLKSLVDYLGMDMKDVIAIGDNYNDIEMLKEAGLGAAVANAQEVCKQASDYICERDHDHDAVAEVIEKFIMKGDRFNGCKE